MYDNLRERLLFKKKLLQIKIEIGTNVNNL